MAYVGNTPELTAQRIVTEFTATAGQTTFSPSSGYTVGYIDVYLNGIKLVLSDDYTAANGTTVVLTVAASLNDVIETVAYKPRGLTDVYDKAEADAKFLEAADGLSIFTTTTLTEGTNLYYTDSRARSAISVTDSGGDGSLSYNNTTGVFTYTGPSATEVRAHFSASTGITITNGAIATTITQYTDALARAAVSVTDSGGDGSLSYNNSTGVFTYTGPSSSEVRAHFSAGTGVTITNGQIAIGQAVGTSDSPSFTNLTLTGYLRGPSSFTIDPSAHGDNTGTVVIAGNLQVDGTTTTVNSTTVTIDDKNIVLADNATTASEANGAGITVNGANASISYNSTTDAWDINKTINVTGGVTASSNFTVSGGTANGVAYLNGSKVLTTGSALTYNGTKLQVGTFGSTGRLFELYGSETLFDGAGPFEFIIGDGGVAYMSLATTDNATALKIRNYSGNSDIAVFERTTGNVGIGSSPSSEGKLTVGTGTITDKNGIIFYRGAASSVSATQAAIFNELNGISTSESLTLRSPAGYKFQNNDGSTEWMRLNSTGLGIGTSSPASRLEVVAGTGGQFIGTFRTGDATAGNNAGGGFYGTSSATAGSREAIMWLDADAANFTGTDYFWIKKVGSSGDTNIIQQSNAAMTFATNGTERARITSAGRLGIGLTTPLTLLHINTGGTTRGLTIDNSYSGGAGGTSGVSVANTTNDLITLRAAYGDNPDSVSNAGMKWGIHFSGYNGDTWPLNGKSAAIYAVSEETEPAGYNRKVGLSFWTSAFDQDYQERLRITNDGNVGINVQTPFSRLQSGGHTFSGGNGMYSDARVGISNHGNLTGLMLASTYDDSTYPEYGLVFVQGPSTSNYNVWSLSPDGPARGNKLNVIYGANAANIHTGTPKASFHGSGTYSFNSSNGIRTGRSVLNWYQWGGNPGTIYLHIKTNLWGGGSPNGNSQPTMSMFHIKGYMYDAQTIDSMMGFHNWMGAIYSFAASNSGTRAAAQGAYVSSDGYVVLVINTGTSYPGISIDYHQSYPYTWVDVQVLASSSSASTTGVY